MRCALGLLSTLATLAGCGFSETEGRAWCKRVLSETPRIAQLAFALPEAPVSTYNKDGKYPDWIGEITFDEFEWVAESKLSYRARATARLEPGPRLQVGAPPRAPATIAITIGFFVHETPPPLMFLPSGHSLVPSRWYLQAIDGTKVDESGSAADYRSGE